VKKRKKRWLVVLKDSSVKVKELLSLDTLGESVILAGEGGLDRFVKHINIMVDLDIEKWIAGEEMILTTAEVLDKADLDKQIEILEALDSGGVSGMLIKVQPYREALPEDFRKRADELAFPLIDIAYDTAFTDIMSGVYKMIYDRQSEVLRRVETIHNDTMAVVLKGGGLSDILKSLSRTIKNPVFVKDHYFEDLYYHNDLRDLMLNKLVENVETTFRRNKSLRKQSKVSVDRVLLEDGEVDRLLVPIVVKNQIFGHMVSYGLYEPISEFDKLNLESVSNVIALELLKQLSVQEVENRYKVEFFEDLVSLDAYRRSTAIERAGNHRFTTEGAYAIYNLRLSKDPVAQDAMGKVGYLLELILKDKGRPYLIAVKESEANVLIQFRSEEDFEKIAGRMGTLFYEVLSKKIYDEGLLVGIGRIYKRLDDVHRSLKDALKAVKAAGLMVPSDPVIRFDSLGIYKILTNEAIRDELEIFYRRTLKDLAAYDEKRDTELIKTLEVYFECNGNLKKMSEVLFTHYNTVLYRINRIEEITGVSLSHEKDRYALQTALKIMKVLDLS
jgi:purine catabolism regulator